MTRDGIRYHKNRSATDPCPVCNDDGWVVLAGTKQHHGYTYSHGSSPCHWCEAGSEAFTQARNRRTGSTKEAPESNYTIEDVDGYDPNPEYPSKAQTIMYIKAVMPQFQRP